MPATTSFKAGRWYSKLYFGTAGIPRTTPAKSTVDGVKHIRTLGLAAMELEFVYGVRMKKELALEVRKVAERNNVHLSVHAPYYINLNAQDEKKLRASKKRILDSAMVGTAAGAESIVFHPGFYLNMEKDKVYATIKKGLVEVLTELHEQDIGAILRPETTGKNSQFGSFEELLRLSSELENVLPCIDFAHLHAKAGGKLNSFEEFWAILSSYEEHLGKDALNELHIHVAGIEYTPKGEKNHLNLPESDFNYRELLKALKEFGCGGLLICESPNLEGDALLLQQNYEEL